MESSQKKVIGIIVALLMIIGIITGAWFLFNKDKNAGSKPDGDGSKPGRDDGFFDDFDDVKDFKGLKTYIEKFNQSKINTENVKFFNMTVEQEDIKKGIKKLDELVIKIGVQKFEDFIVSMSLENQNKTSSDDAELKNAFNLFEGLGDKTAKFVEKYQKKFNETQKALVGNITNYNQTIYKFSEIQFNFLYFKEDDIKDEHKKLLKKVKEIEKIKEEKYLKVITNIQNKTIVQNLTLLNLTNTLFQSTAENLNSFEKNFNAKQKKVVDDYNKEIEIFDDVECYKIYQNKNIGSGDDFTTAYNEYMAAINSLKKVISDECCLLGFNDCCLIPFDEKKSFLNFINLKNDVNYETYLGKEVRVTNVIKDNKKEKENIHSKIIKLQALVNDINKKLLSEKDGEFAFNQANLNQLFKDYDVNDLKFKSLKNIYDSVIKQINLLQTGMNEKKCKKFDYDDLKQQTENFVNNLKNLLIKNNDTQKAMLKYVMKKIGYQMEKLEIAMQNQDFKDLINNEINTIVNTYVYVFGHIKHKDDEIKYIYDQYQETIKNSGNNDNSGDNNSTNNNN